MCVCEVAGMREADDGGMCSRRLIQGGERDVTAASAPCTSPPGPDTDSPALLDSARGPAECVYMPVITPGTGT